MHYKRPARGLRFAPLLLASAMLAACGAIAPAASPTWQNAAPMPEPRQELYPEVLDGKIYVAGGILNPNTTFSDRFDAYDPATNRWTSLAPLPEARHHITLSAVDGLIYGIGGFTGGFPNWQARPTMWIYDRTSNRWAKGVDMLTPRAEGVAGVVDGKIYWIGGRVGDAPGADHFNEHADSTLNEVFDPATRQWSTRSPAPTARNSAAAAVIDGKIYVVGGRRFLKSNDGTTRQINFDTLEVYDPATDSWAAKAPMPQAQGGLGAAAIAGKLYACGGEQWLPEQAVLSECWSYDPGTDRWAALPALPTARHGIGMAAIGKRLYVIGGALRPGGNFATTMNQLLQVP